MPPLRNLTNSSRNKPFHAHKSMMIEFGSSSSSTFWGILSIYSSMRPEQAARRSNATQEYSMMMMMDRQNSYKTFFDIKMKEETQWGRRFGDLFFNERRRLLLSHQKTLVLFAFYVLPLKCVLVKTDRPLIISRGNWNKPIQKTRNSRIIPQGIIIFFQSLILRRKHAINCLFHPLTSKLASVRGWSSNPHCDPTAHRSLSYESS